jgi:hypothetical protein
MFSHMPALIRDATCHFHLARAVRSVLHPVFATINLLIIAIKLQDISLFYLEIFVVPNIASGIDWSALENGSLTRSKLKYTTTAVHCRKKKNSSINKHTLGIKGSMYANI